MSQIKASLIHFAEYQRQSKKDQIGNVCDKPQIDLAREILEMLPVLLEQEPTVREAIEAELSRNPQYDYSLPDEYLPNVPISTTLGVSSAVAHFRLRNQHGKWVDSKKLLKQCPLVVVFYQGKASTLCMIMLRVFKSIFCE